MDALGWVIGFTNDATAPSHELGKGCCVLVTFKLAWACEAGVIEGATKAVAPAVGEVLEVGGVLWWSGLGRGARQEASLTAGEYKASFNFGCIEMDFESV